MTGPVPAEAVLDHIEPGADMIVGTLNGEPIGVIDALEANHTQLDDVRLHQMHSEHPRPSIHGAYGDRLRHVSYFLSHVTRPAYWAGQCDLVPNHFSELPQLLRTSTQCSLVVAAVSPPNRHGYFSLGTQADYSAALIGKAPFFVEVNHQMPRTHGLNQIHVSQVLGWCERDAPLIALPPALPDERDRLIAEQIVERIPNGATIQIGVGGIPNAVLASLRDHRDLGIHTEALSDGVLDLVERGVITGTRKALHPNKIVTTLALGTHALYDWIHENSAIEFLPVDYVNDPRVVAQEKAFVSINATTEVDLFGQCASETIAGRYWSSSGGQADFARGAMYSDGGQAFIVLHSTTRTGRSRIRVRLTEGSVVTTLKNTVDNVVTEWGIAKLRGRSIGERARALVAIAHPDHRDALEAEAREAGIWDTRGRAPEPVS
jgi:acyl-CoA hydrolase